MYLYTYSYKYVLEHRKFSFSSGLNWAPYDYTIHVHCFMLSFLYSRCVLSAFLINEYCIVLYK